MEIITKSGHRILLDDADWPLVRDHTWHIGASASGKLYATTNVERATHTCRSDRYTTVKMHQLILPVPKPFWVDHRNGDGLDNRRSNLRQSTPTQNAANRKRNSNSSQPYKGVTAHYGKWKAEIGHGETRCYIGRFATAEQAALAYNKKAVEMYGDFAKVNEVSG